MIDISVGVALFNDCDFFSAHDFFEDIWMEADRNEKEFFQGLVQVSVGCYHFICGNLKGAKSQLSKGKSKLTNFEPNYYNINLMLLNSKVELLIHNLDSKKNIKQKIPTIEFINKIS
jgi:predicted metal-dependent hydrolase